MGQQQNFVLNDDQQVTITPGYIDDRGLPTTVPPAAGSTLSLVPVSSNPAVVTVVPNSDGSTYEIVAQGLGTAQVTDGSSVINFTVQASAAVDVGLTIGTPTQQPLPASGSTATDPAASVPAASTAPAASAPAAAPSAS